MSSGDSHGAAIVAQTSQISVAHLITDLDIGGAEMMMARLIESDTSGHFRHSVISLSHMGPIGERLLKRGVTVIPLDLVSAWDAPAVLWQLTRVLRVLRPSLLQTWLYHADFAGLIAGSLAGIPSIVWNIRCAELELRDYPAFMRFLLRTLAWTSNRPAAVVANSHAGRAAHEQVGYAPRQWKIIPNGIDTSAFRPSSLAREQLRRSLKLDAGTNVVGILARYHPMKDHLTFFKAAAEIVPLCPDTHWVAAGRGVAHNELLIGAIRQFGLTGHVSLMAEQRDPAEFLAALDVAVMCSSSGEGFPNVVAEAMACGVPCVVTNVGDAASIVANTGVVVPIGDAAGIAHGVLRLLSLDATERSDASRAARDRVVQNFEIARTAVEYTDFYDELISRG